MNNIPKVCIKPFKLDENTFTFTTGGIIKTWNVKTLHSAAKDIQAFDLPLVGIDISTSPWGTLDTLSEFIYESKRVDKAKFDYPIILDDNGFICDGWHRVVKAILKGHKTIKAIRLDQMPEPDNVRDKENA